LAVRNALVRGGSHINPNTYCTYHSIPTSCTAPRLNLSHGSTSGSTSDLTSGLTSGSKNTVNQVKRGERHGSVTRLKGTVERRYGMNG